MDRRFGEKPFHDVGPLLTPLPAHPAAHRAGGKTVGGGVKPADQNGVTAESVGLAGEFDEDNLALRMPLKRCAAHYPHCLVLAACCRRTVSAMAESWI